MTVCLYTVGHSNRTLDELVLMLRAHAIRSVVDVRAWPRSRRHPHFDADEIAVALPAAGIAYHHAADLGGRRQPGPGAAAHAGWREEAFRAYAEFMGTPRFRAAIDALLDIAAVEGPTAILCAEADWRRCHRQLIADGLLVRGIAVRHIVAADRVEEARLTPFAEVDGERIDYPAPQGGLF